MTTRVIKQFLVTYDRTTDHAEVEQFGTDMNRAMAAYEAAEDRYRDRLEIDVVLLGSDSLASIRSTHASYFGGPNILLDPAPAN